MKASRTTCLAAVFGAGCQAFGARALVWAEPLPPHAHASLARILAQEEFSLARNEPSQWDLLTARVLGWIAQQLSELWSSLPWDKLEVSKDSWFARALAKIAAFLEWCLELLEPVLQNAGLIAVAGLVLLAAWLAYRYYLLRADKPAMEPRKIAERTLSQQLTWEAVRALGSSTAALAAFREFIRQEFYRTYSLRPSLTDREMGRCVPLEDSRRNSFLEAAGAFENVVFAGGAFDPVQFGEVLQRFESSVLGSKRVQS